MQLGVQGHIHARPLCKAAPSLPPCLPPCCSLSQLSPAACWCLTRCPQTDAHPLGAEAERQPSSSPAAPRSRARGSVGSDITRGYFVARLCKYRSAQRLQLSRRAIPSPRLCGSRSLLPDGYFAPALLAPCAPKSQTPPAHRVAPAISPQDARRVPSPTGSALAPCRHRSARPRSPSPILVLLGHGARACRGGPSCRSRRHPLLPGQLGAASGAASCCCSPANLPQPQRGLCRWLCLQKVGSPDPPPVLGSTPRCVEHPPGWPRSPPHPQPPAGAGGQLLAGQD